MVRSIVPRFPQARAVLFDLDGTLIDSAPDLGAAANQMRVVRGLAPLPLERYRPVAGAGARGLLGQAFGVTPEAANFEALREEFFSHYQACLAQHTVVFDGVAQVLERLVQAQLPWGVVTNKSARFTQPLVQGYPLFATAGAVISGDTTPYAKPHPAPLLEAASRLAVAPQDCIYVGDDPRDIQAGRAAGMATVAALYGYLGHDQDPFSWGADATIRSPLELLEQKTQETLA